MSGVEILFVSLGIVFGGGGLGVLVYLLPTLRRMRAETHKVDVDAAVAEDTAADARWQAMLEQQRLSLIEPMRQRIEELTTEVGNLRDEIRSVTSRYRAAIRTLRAYVAWIAEHIPDGTPPPIPPELADDL